MGLIFVLNTGSSSQKCALFETHSLKRLWQAHLSWKEGFKEVLLAGKGAVSLSSHKEGIALLFDLLFKECDPNTIDAVSHRIVHGGKQYHLPTRITKKVEEDIAALSHLAPLHNPVNLLAIEMAIEKLPKIPHVALFDTAFHATLSEEIFTYAIPYKWSEAGYRKYGFHGISHAYCSKRGVQCVPEAKRVIVCHLGAGASLAAVKEGKCIDTTMGFTPIEGLMMASRSGSLDPGLLLHLLEREKLSTQELSHILNFESGLFGVSGITEDMHTLLTSDDKRGRLAVKMFVARLIAHIGSLIATLGGLDLLIFTAGIGENAPWIRSETCRAFNFLNLILDERANNAYSQEERLISAPSSKVMVYVIPTNEEKEMAQQTKPFLSVKNYNEHDHPYAEYE